MALDVLKWLREDMKFSEDEAKVVQPLITADRAEAIEKSMLRQQDYSRHMDGLTKAQTDLTAANTRLDAEMAEWAATQARGEEATVKQEAALRKAEEAALKLQQTVRSLAVQAGVDPEKALEGIPVTKPIKTDDAPPPINTDNFLTREHGHKLAALTITMPAEIAALQHEHHELTGEWLDARALATEVLARLNTRGNQKSTDVRVVWEELNDVPTKRTAKAKATHDADIAAAEQRGREAALSEAVLPGQPAPGRTAPIFRHLGGPDRKSVLNRPQPGTTVAAAVGAFRSGKYRQQPAGAGAPAAKTG